MQSHQRSCFTYHKANLGYFVNYRFCSSSNDFQNRVVTSGGMKAMHSKKKWHATDRKLVEVGFLALFPSTCFYRSERRMRFWRGFLNFNGVASRVVKDKEVLGILWVPTSIVWPNPTNQKSELSASVPIVTKLSRQTPFSFLCITITCNNMRNLLLSAKISWTFFLLTALQQVVSINIRRP